MLGLFIADNTVQQQQKISVTWTNECVFCFMECSDYRDTFGMSLARQEVKLIQSENLVLLCNITITKLSPSSSSLPT